MGDLILSFLLLKRYKVKLYGGIWYICQLVKKKKEKKQINKRNLCLVAFADFHDVNIPTMANFHVT